MKRIAALMLLMVMSGSLKKTTPRLAWSLPEHPKHERPCQTPAFMHGWRIVLLIIILFSSNVLAAPVKTSCVDSDHGTVYAKKGIAAGNWLQNFSLVGAFTDTCKEEGGKVLIEYYCDETVVFNVSFTCSKFCQDGACVDALRIPQTCEDSDGMNSSLKGTIRAQTFNLSWSSNASVSSETRQLADYCVVKGNPDAPVPACEAGEHCAVIEYSCVSAGIDRLGRAEIVACPEGCKEGACLEKKVEVKTNVSTTLNVSINGSKNASNYSSAGNTTASAASQKTSFLARIIGFLKRLLGK